MLPFSRSAQRGLLPSPRGTMGSPSRVKEQGGSCGCKVGRLIVSVLKVIREQAVAESDCRGYLRRNSPSTEEIKGQ